MDPISEEVTSHQKGNAMVSKLIGGCLQINNETSMYQKLEEYSSNIFIMFQSGIIGGGTQWNAIPVNKQWNGNVHGHTRRHRRMLLTVTTASSRIFL
jgi:hypothetical protein